MALIWADGFDHYGGNNTFMSQAGYQIITLGNPQSNTSVARTGNGYCSFGSNAYLRRVISSPGRIIGVGIGANQTVAGTSDSRARSGIHFETATGTAAIRLTFNSTLGFTAYNDTGSTIYGSSMNNIYNLNNWNEIEAKLTMNSGTNTSDASLEVRLQGSTVLTINNLNLNGVINSIVLGNPFNVTVNNTVLMDDFLIWDTTGSYNNDFMGIRYCNTRYPNANSALQDWTPASGNAWAEVSAVPPVDATSYIQAAATGDISEFSHQALAVLTNDIAGVVAISRAYLDSAGSSTYRVGVNSNSVVSNSPDITPGTTGGYSQYILERDPNGGGQWSQAAFDASLIRVTRDT